MVEGQDRDRPFPLGGLDDSGGLHNVGDQVSVGEHDALRQAGRAARVGQRHQVVPRIDRYGRNVIAPFHQGREGRGPGRLAKNENLLHGRLACRLERVVEELGDGDQVLRSGVIELKRELAWRR